MVGVTRVYGTSGNKGELRGMEEQSSTVLTSCDVSSLVVD